MRWRFVDTVTSLEPWRRAAGRKAVSLEEYLLLEPLGREGAFPETLVLECCVELARWVVLVSSSFTHTAVLQGVRGFGVSRAVGEGIVLDVRADVISRGEDAVTVACEVAAVDGPRARGEFTLRLLPVASETEREEMRTRWREVHRAA